MKRAQFQSVLDDLRKKMVFVAGPRQSGKTWLSKEIMSMFKNSLYLNFDNPDHLDIIKRQDWLPQNELIIFDELHKMTEWKNYLKGVYDTKASSTHIMVTGSARLETFSRVGDSLAGRYFLHHLLPLSLAELRLTNQPIDFDRMLKRSGFPEPYLATNDVDAERWRKQYSESLLSTDVFEYETIQNNKAIRLLFELLRRRVGSSVSYQSLAEDIGVSSVTIKKYIDVLEALYIVFRVTPLQEVLLKNPKFIFSILVW